MRTEKILPSPVLDLKWMRPQTGSHGLSLDAYWSLSSGFQLRSRRRNYRVQRGLERRDGFPQRVQEFHLDPTNHSNIFNKQRRTNLGENTWHGKFVKKLVISRVRNLLILALTWPIWICWGTVVWLSHKLFLLKILIKIL